MMRAVMTRPLSIACLLGLAALPARAADPVTTVEGLYQAVAAAQAGETIRLGSGTFALTQTLTLDKAVTISGATAGETVLRAPADAGFTAVDINHAQAVLEKVAVTGISFESKPTTAAPGGTYDASGAWKSPLCVKIQAGTLRDATIRDNLACLQRGEGIWLWMSGGTAECVRVTGNRYDRQSGTVLGYAVRVRGDGRLVNCEIDRNACNWAFLGAVCLGDSAQMKGGSVHDNDAQAPNYHGGLFVQGSALVEGVRIYANSNGLRLEGGTARNCLVYGNRNGLGHYSGVSLSSGSLLNCTIVGNVTLPDAEGLSGLEMSGGTAENNIVWGNGPAGGQAGSLAVTGGTFNNNVTDKDVGRGSGNVVGNPAFADLSAGDYSLTAGSAARDVGTARDDVTDDFVGTARPQGAAPDAGAYEFVPGDGPACAIRINESVFPEGGDATVTAVLEGAAGEGTLAWYVDGVLTGETTARPTFSGLALGRHTIRLVVTVGGVSCESTVADAIELKPTKVYVSRAGSATYPYATEKTAANDVNAALAAVYSDATTVGRVSVAAGTYLLTDTLVLPSPIEVIGAGRDETVVSAGALANTGRRGAHLTHPRAALRDFTLTGSTNKVLGCGVYLKNGTLAGLRVTRSYQMGQGDNYNKGAGVYMTDGVITNALIDRNYLKADYHGSSGLGVYMTGGTVVDSEICHNWMERSQHNGIGIFASGGTVRRCRLHDNESTLNSAGGSGGWNLSSGHGAYLTGTAALEDSLVYSNGICGVMINGPSAVMRNCLVYGHRKGTLDWFAGVNLANGTLVNCTIADNCADGDSNGKSGLWQTGGTAVNNLVYGNGKPSIGEALLSGGTRESNVIGLDPKFADAAANDFHLTRSSAVAIDKGAARPELDHDLDGVARPQKNGWDVGCYECVPSTEKTAVISLAAPAYAPGQTISAKAETENIDVATATFSWTLTGPSPYAVSGTGEPYRTFTRPDAAIGDYELSLTVTVDGEEIPALTTERLVVQPTVVYVSTTGSATPPYDTEDKATSDLTAAMRALWQSEDATSTVHVAAGGYQLTAPVVLTAPVRVLGAGRDRTVFSCGSLDENSRAILCAHDDALVRGLTVAGVTNRLTGVGSAVRLEKGLLDDVRIRDTMILNIMDSKAARAGGLMLCGGIATNLFVDGSRTQNNYGDTQGLGVFIEDGLLVDSVVCSNVLNRYETSAMAVCMEGGVLRRAKIFANSAIDANNTRGVGLGLSSGSPVAEEVEVWGCLNAVYVKAGTLRNSLVFGNTSPTDERAAGITVSTRQEWEAPVAVVNCTAAGNLSNGEPFDLKVGAGGRIVNTIAPSATVADGATVVNCLFNGDPKFVHAGSGNFRLRSDSPAIDAGDDAAWSGRPLAEATDLSGNPRLKGAHIDLGCYEWRPSGLMMLVR